MIPVRALRRPLLSDRQAQQSHTTTDALTDGTALEAVKDAFSTPDWIRARRTSTKRKFPQTIAHRGYRAKFPENTLKAFQGAVEVGSHAIETDIHLSKDDVVVLSHDPDLKRCYGRGEKILECTWDFLSTVRTTKAPHEPMPRLRDLLEYVAQPQRDHIWLLLDIKLDNDAETVMRLIAETLNSTSPGSRSWEQRVVLGVWAARYLSLCVRYLPNYTVAHIGFSTCYARQFLKVPHISFNMLQKILMGPIGARFMRDVKKAQRPLFVWTVNAANMMKWSIQKEVDGVITDDPKLFNDICENWSDDEPIARLSWFQWLYTFWLHIIILAFGISFKQRFPKTIERFIRSRNLRAQATRTLEE